MSSRSIRALALAAFAMFPAGAFATDYTSPAAGTAVNKASAAPVGPLFPGDTLGGTVSNTSATSSYHLISVAPQAPGIYRQRLTFANQTTSTRAWVRGLNQTGGAAGTTDTAIQTANAAQNGFVQWYGFGKQEQFYLQAFGTTTDAASVNFSLTYSTEAVTPLDLGSVTEGSLTISGTVGPNRKQLHVLDANLNPIPGLQDADTTARGINLVAALTPGVYYLATGLSNVATNLPAPATSGIRTNALLDFPGMLISGSTAGTTTDLGLTITDVNGAHPIAIPRGGSYEVQFVRFTVAAVPEPTAAAPVALVATALLRRRRA